MPFPPVEGCGDDVRQQPGLNYDQHRAGGAHDDQRDQKRARGPGVLQQPRVDRPAHQLMIPRPINRIPKTTLAVRAARAPLRLSQPLKRATAAAVPSGLVA